MKRLITIISVIVLLASCASKKAVTDGSATTGLSKTQKSEQQAFMKRVLDNQVQARNIVASADFRLVAGNKDLSCDGKISMRRDEVIRLQLLLPIIRTEIARIDFTPDYVLLVDRFHKEYIKASYKDVSFLADNGLSFYSLQALFWNQLFLPGEKAVGEQMLQRFTCSLTDVATTVPVGYKSGKIEYQWKASKATAQITGAGANYESTGHGKSSLIWTYDNFRSFDGRQFPLSQQFAVTTDITGRQQAVQLTVKMSSPKNSADWDVETQLSGKYKKIEAQDILKKLMSIQ